MLIVLTAIVFAVIGLVLGAGGTRLLLLGGSPYYLIAGLGFLLTAFLLFRRAPGRSGSMRLLSSDRLPGQFGRWASTGGNSDLGAA